MTNTEAKEGFAKWLARTMELQGVSGRQIAKELGKDGSQVSDWKNGKAVPNAELCVRLGSMLQVESPLRLLINAGHLPPELAKAQGLEPLPIPEYDPERERTIRKIKKTFPREEWDMWINAWEKNRKEGT